MRCTLPLPRADELPEIGGGGRAVIRSDYSFAKRTSDDKIGAQPSNARLSRHLGEFVCGNQRAQLRVSQPLPSRRRPAPRNRLRSPSKVISSSAANTHQSATS